MVHQGAESQRFSARCTCSFHRFWLAAHFCSLLSPWRFVLSGFLMSRGDELRQLAARSFQYWPRWRTPSQWASPGSWAPPVQVVAPFLLTLARLWLPLFRQRAAVPAAVPSPSHEVAASLLRSASLRAASPRTRALALALLRRCPNVLHVHRVAAPALPLACVVQSLLRSRDWLRAWPPRVAHRSRLPSCAFHASLALSTLPQLGRSPPPTSLDPLHPSAPASEAPRATESASNSDDGWDALHDAHGLAPSLGGTAAAVALPSDAAGASRRARDKRRRR